MTLEKLYNYSVRLLKKKNIPSPEIDAGTIIAYFLNFNRNELFLHKTEKIGILMTVRIIYSIIERLNFKPIAYILGYKYFFQDKFIVSRKTLIPRADTEHLLYAVQNGGMQFYNILDIGTGSGAIAISLSRLFPEAKIKAVDINIKTAKMNIERLGVKNVELIKINFLKHQKLITENYDLIISNPPYLSDEDLKKLGKDAAQYEPKKVFYGGKDGLDFYRAIADKSFKVLNKDGWIVLEVDYKWQKVKEIFNVLGFNKFEIIRDYNDLERVLVIQK